MSFQFDASNIDPAMGMEPFPAGWNPVVITGHTIKGTKSNNGSGLLQLALKHTETGKAAAWVINLWNINPQAKEIAERELAAIVHCTLGVTQGRYAFQHPDELNNIPFYLLNVPDKEGRNDFKGVKDSQGNDPQKQGGGAPAPGPQFGGGNQPSGVPAQGGAPGPFGGGQPQGQPQTQQFPASGPGAGQPGPQNPTPAGAPSGGPAFGGGQPTQPPTNAPAPNFGPQGGNVASPSNQPVQGNTPGNWPAQGGGQPAPGQPAPWGGGQ